MSRAGVTRTDAPSRVAQARRWARCVSPGLLPHRDGRGAAERGHPCPQQRPSAPGLRGPAAAAVRPSPHAVSSISGPRARLQPEGERRFLLGFDPGSLRGSGRRPWLPAPPGHPQDKLRLLPPPEFQAIREPGPGDAQMGLSSTTRGSSGFGQRTQPGECTLSRGEAWNRGCPTHPSTSSQRLNARV